MFLMDIVRAGGEMFDVCPQEIMSVNRSRSTVRARHAVQKAMSLRGNSAAKIGTVMDRKRTTVVHALRMADKWSEADPVYKEQIERLASLSGKYFKH